MTPQEVDPGQATLEVNFDGLVGPTHNFAGLAPGNLASWSHRRQVSHPRAAALQGLEKMRRLMNLGVPQAVLPPHPRPNLDLLRLLGFRGNDREIIDQARRESTGLVSIASSGSSMWVANAATVCPSADAQDGKIHFTPANLSTSLHRASESKVTGNLLKAIFHDPQCFVHHEPLPAASDFGDEGAANHTRLGDRFDRPGTQLFVYGADRTLDRSRLPQRYPARQSKMASEAVARLHGLDPQRVIFARQNPDAIEAGVFHNDVIAVGHQQLFFCHQAAFAEPKEVYDALRESCNDRINIVEIASSRLKLEDAVATYLFNSQIVTTAEGKNVLIATDHCRQNAATNALLAELVDDAVFDSVEFVDVSQSMNNGGGPACLRLRVIMSPQQRAAMHPGVVFTESLFDALSAWISKHYREDLSPADLGDPQLMQESYAALDELTEILGLGTLYDFQTSTTKNQQTVRRN